MKTTTNCNHSLITVSYVLEKEDRILLRELEFNGLIEFRGDKSEEDVERCNMMCDAGILQRDMDSWHETYKRGVILLTLGDRFKVVV